eukprot:gnl/MRDRNA2_/MRDRNA2_116286_c0_seq1.p2 gnl/MRDRNA2_/MRDRNA2_116286_c0~~gnl/MRDRNA2_/MRDRNA2_116286_c0_seq1.p2  ORF type:complete len:121 (+),score=39.01 gnl/MRDRNA2_/MRDRNA2_116286_c0_seq1:409-771(+)
MPQLILVIITETNQKEEKEEQEEEEEQDQEQQEKEEDARKEALEESEEDESDDEEEEPRLTVACRRHTPSIGPFMLRRLARRRKVVQIRQNLRKLILPTSASLMKVMSQSCDISGRCEPR